MPRVRAQLRKGRFRRAYRLREDNWAKKQWLLSSYGSICQSCKKTFPPKELTLHHEKVKGSVLRKEVLLCKECHDRCDPVRVPLREAKESLSKLQRILRKPRKTRVKKSEAVKGSWKKNREFSQLFEKFHQALGEVRDKKVIYFLVGKKKTPHLPAPQFWEKIEPSPFIPCLGKGDTFPVFLLHIKEIKIKKGRRVKSRPFIDLVAVRLVEVRSPFYILLAKEHILRQRSFDAKSFHLYKPSSK